MARTLEDDRYKEAAAAFEEADFEGRAVAGTSGWEYDGEERLVQTVFFENPLGDSIPMQVSIDFEEGSRTAPAGLDFELPEDPGLLYGFYVNLDERGEYKADVRNALGATVFEYSTNDEGRIELVDDGFLKHARDLDGLAEYLCENGILPSNAELLDMPDFETRLEPFRRNEPQLDF